MRPLLLFAAAFLSACSLVLPFDQSSGDLPGPRPEAGPKDTLILDQRGQDMARTDGPIATRDGPRDKGKPSDGPGDKSKPHEGPIKIGDGPVKIDKAKVVDLFTVADKASPVDGSKSVVKGVSGSLAAATSSPREWFHVPACTGNRLLLVFVAIFDSAKVNSVTHDGLPLTLVHRTDTGTFDAGTGVGMSTEIWSRTGVGSACSGTYQCKVTVTLSASAANVVGSSDWCGVAAGQLPYGGSAYFTVPQIAATTVGLAPGSVVVDVVAAESKNNMTLQAAGTGQSVVWQRAVNLKEAAASSEAYEVSGTANVLWKPTTSVSFTVARTYVLLAP